VLLLFLSLQKLVCLIVSKRNPVVSQPAANQSHAANQRVVLQNHAVLLHRFAVLLNLSAVHQLQPAVLRNLAASQPAANHSPAASRSAVDDCVNCSQSAVHVDAVHQNPAVLQLQRAVLQVATVAAAAADVVVGTKQLTYCPERNSLAGIAILQSYSDPRGHNSANFAVG